MGTGCGFGSGVGSGSGHGSAPPGVPCIDLCGSSDELVSAPPYIDLCSSFDESSDDLNGPYFDLQGPGPGGAGSISRRTFDTSSESHSSSDDPDDFRLDAPGKPEPPLNLFHLPYCMFMSLPYEAAVQFERCCAQYLCAPPT